MNIGVLGAGAWAIGLASLLHQRGHSICMWEFNQKEADQLRRLREHPLKLPGVFLSESVEITNDCAAALGFGPVMVVAVPAQFLRGALKHIVKATTPEVRRGIQAWVIVSKGIENGTGALMTDVMVQEVPELDEQKLVVLSGPSLAAEVARHVPTTVVAASRSEALAKLVQQEFSTDSFRIYTNDDVRGVELAGSTKNIMAVAAGICDGLGLGNNTKGALLTRGLVEMRRLGQVRRVGGSGAEHERRAEADGDGCGGCRDGARGA
jgi:glycerol-3-phosphate dehydrogenase (NAD(P)+)